MQKKYRLLFFYFGIWQHHKTDFIDTYRIMIGWRFTNFACVVILSIGGILASLYNNTLRCDLVKICLWIIKGIMIIKVIYKALYYFVTEIENEIIFLVFSNYLQFFLR